MPEAGPAAAGWTGDGGEQSGSQFVMAYFKTEVEALHRGLVADGRAWTPLRNNWPFALGAGASPAVRDLHISRDHAGTFHLFFAGGWDADAITHGTSPDLLAWSAPRHVGVIANIAGAHDCGDPT